MQSFRSGVSWSGAETRLKHEQLRKIENHCFFLTPLPTTNQLVSFHKNCIDIHMGGVKKCYTL